MTRYEDGALVMDTDYAPLNSDKPLNKADGPINFVVVSYYGVLETNSGMLLEDTEEVRKLVEENENLHIIASGTSEVSLAELSYTMQSPARQLYRATMADLNEFLKQRFTGDDEIMREICNLS
jgi:hypothetical protein